MLLASLLCMMTVMVGCQAQSSDGCNACKNGGKLSVTESTLTCICPTGFSGVRCEKVDNPCRNGGIQETTDGDCVVCHCPDNFYGQFCEKACPSGFALLKGSLLQPIGCYALTLKKLNWNDAGPNCGTLAKNAALAVVDTADKNNFLKNKISKSDQGGCTQFWTSGQRERVNDCSAKFFWKPSNAPATPIAFTDWEDKDPNCLQSGSETESCVTFFNLQSWKWNDATCSMQTCAVCEAPL